MNIHWMRRSWISSTLANFNLLEKTFFIAGLIECGRKYITETEVVWMHQNTLTYLSKLWGVVMDGEVWSAAIHGCNSWILLSDWTEAGGRYTCDPGGRMRMWEIDRVEDRGNGGHRKSSKVWSSGKAEVKKGCGNHHGTGWRFRAARLH